MHARTARPSTRGACSEQCVCKEPLNFFFYLLSFFERWKNGICKEKKGGVHGTWRGLVCAGTVVEGIQISTCTQAVEGCRPSLTSALNLSLAIKTIQMMGYIT